MYGCPAGLYPTMVDLAMGVGFATMITVVGNIRLTEDY